MRRTTHLIIAGALLLAAGCGSPEAIKFNNAILNANNRVATASVAFQAAVGAEMNSAKVDSAKLKTSYDEVVKAFDDAKQEMKDLKIPDKPSAKAFYDAHQKYLEGQEQNVKVNYKEILDAMSLPPDQRRQKIDQSKLRVMEREKADLPGLQAAQRAFAAEYHIKMQ